MTDAKTSERMSPKLQKVVARAREHPEEKILSLAHRIDVPALERAYCRLREKAAVGVDGVTRTEYGQDLERKLQTVLVRESQCASEAQKVCLAGRLRSWRQSGEH
jgi:hypothetical protein